MNGYRALAAGVKEPSSVTTAPGAKTGLISTRQAQELVTSSEATGCTTQYALGTDAATEPSADAYAATIPTATAAGTYTGWYKVLGDNTHTDSSPASVKVTIVPKEVGLSWANTKFNYDGKSHVPAATATGLVNGDTCAVTVTGAQTKAGTYTAKATELSNANYKLPAKATQSFTIVKNSQKAPSAPVVTAVTGTSITVKTVKCQQYSIDGGKTWQNSGTFKNLTPGKQYTFVTRKAATSAANASPKSAGAKAKTLSNAMLLRSGLKVQETTKNKKTTITVTCGAVPGVTSYDVYVQYCGSNDFSENPTGTIKNGKTSITLSKINGKAIQSGRSYKVLVIAKKGNTTVCQTPILHAAGNTGSYSHVNAMTLNKSAVSLAKGTTFTIKTKVTLVNSKKKPLGNSHGSAYSYLSSNSSVATVEMNGKITARSAGTCVIMVTARNGITKSITVTVK